MLKYKDTEVELEFWDKKVSHATRYVAFWIAEYAHLKFGKDVIITDVLRPVDLDKISAHPEGRAFDFRAKFDYWTPDEIREITLETTLRFGRTDGKKVIMFHGENAEFHGHVQTQESAKVVYFTDGIKT